MTKSIASIIKYHSKSIGINSQNKKNVSFGPSVTVKEIPFHATEDLHRMFYTDEEYNSFEVAEQQRMATIRQLYQEYKRQYRLMTLEVLLQAERVAPAPLNTDAFPFLSPRLGNQQQHHSCNKRTRATQEEQLPTVVQHEEHLKPIPTTKVDAAEDLSHPVDTKSSDDGRVDRFSKRRRTSIVCTLK